MHQGTCGYKDSPTNSTAHINLYSVHEENHDNDDDFEVGMQRAGQFSSSYLNSTWKTIKQGILVTLLGIAIIGVISGISRNSKSKRIGHLPDWGAELQQLEDKGRTADMARGPPSKPEQWGENTPDFLKAKKYDPAWYDQTQGWEGWSFIQVFEFCNAKKKDYVPCPYEVMCPDRPNTTPLGGYKNEGLDGTWAPICELSNEWVKVSEGEDSCFPFTIKFPEEEGGPMWGETGEGNEEITRHVMCCKPKPEESSSLAPEKAEVAAEAETSVATTEVTATQAATTTTTTTII